MRQTLIVVETQTDWLARFGSLPSSPLGGYEGPGLYDKKTGDYAGTQREGVCRPYYIADIPDHEAPSGRIVTSQSGRREEIKRSEGKLIPWEPITNRPRGTIGDRKTAEKYGVMKPGGLVHYSDTSAEWVRAQNAAVADGLAPTESGRVKLSKNAKPHKPTASEVAEIKHVLDKHGIKD
ncbi:MAG: hypothetical protein RLZ98_3523 [Pseudomonadota bacterium]|jgi:hypothetical protein